MNNVVYSIYSSNANKIIFTYIRNCSQYAPRIRFYRRIISLLLKHNLLILLSLFSLAVSSTPVFTVKQAWGADLQVRELQTGTG